MKYRRLSNFVFAMAAALPSIHSVQAQSRAWPGNGIIFNATDERIDLVLNRPGADQSSEVKLALESGRSISLRRYQSYELYVPSEREVYPLYVSRAAGADDWHGRFYYFLRAEGKLKLMEGISAEVIETANRSAESTVERVKQKWNVRLDATTERYVPSRILDNIRRIARQLSLRFELVGIGDREDLPNFDMFLVDDATVVVESCRSLAPSTTAFLKSALPNRRGLSKEVVRLCVPTERLYWSDLPELARNAMHEGVEERAAVSAKRHYLGSYAGIDGSHSALDRAVRRYQQYQHIKSRREIEHLEAVLQEVQFDIEFLLQIAQATNLDPNLRDRLAAEIDERIVDHYLVGTLLFFDPNSISTLEVNNVPLVKTARYSSDGAIQTIEKYYTVQQRMRIANINLQFSPEIAGVEARPQGYCTAEAILRRRGERMAFKATGQWKKVNSGLNGFSWAASLYCIRCTKKDGTVVSIAYGYRFEESRSYLISPGGIQELPSR